MFILNKENFTKKMTGKGFREFIFENYDKQISFTKDIIHLLATNLTKKIPDPAKIKSSINYF